MKRILSSDWLTKRAQDFSRWSSRKCCLLGYIINPLLTKLVRSRWLYIGLVSVNKTGKRNLANIQPSVNNGSANSKRAHRPTTATSHPLLPAFVKHLYQQLSKQAYLKLNIGKLNIDKGTLLTVSRRKCPRENWHAWNFKLKIENTLGIDWAHNAYIKQALEKYFKNH